MKNGFTLIEILIVIVIISIVSSVAMLTLSTNQQKKSEQLAKQLENLIELAKEEAIVRPGTLGLMITSSSFQFVMYQEDTHRWRPFLHNVLGLHDIPDGIQITQSVLGKNILNTASNPALIMTSDGEITPFTIWIGKKNKRPSYKVSGNANGEISSVPL